MSYERKSKIFRAFQNILKLLCRFINVASFFEQLKLRNRSSQSQWSWRQLINAITISFSGIISGSVTNLKNKTSSCLFKDLIYRCKWWNTFLFASLVASLVLVFNVEIKYLFLSSLLVENSTRSSLDPNAKFITALKTWQNEFATYMGCWIIFWCLSSLKPLASCQYYKISGNICRYPGYPWSFLHSQGFIELVY